MLFLQYQHKQHLTLLIFLCVFYIVTCCQFIISNFVGYSSNAKKLSSTVCILVTSRYFYVSNCKSTILHFIFIIIFFLFKVNLQLKLQEIANIFAGLGSDRKYFQTTTKRKYVFVRTKTKSRAYNLASENSYTLNPRFGKHTKNKSPGGVGNEYDGSYNSRTFKCDILAHKLLLSS